MNKQLVKNYQRLLAQKNRKVLLDKFFHDFMSEAVYRTTKIEHKDVTRKQIKTILKT